MWSANDFGWDLLKNKVSGSWSSETEKDKILKNWNFNVLKKLNFYAFRESLDSRQSCDITCENSKPGDFTLKISMVRVNSWHNCGWLMEATIQNLKFLGKSFSSTQLGWVIRHSWHYSWKHPNNSVVGLFWLNQVGLPPVVLGPNILSKGVKTGPTATQFGSACAQTMPCLPRAHLRHAELF